MIALEKQFEPYNSSTGVLVKSTPELVVHLLLWQCMVVSLQDSFIDYLAGIVPSLMDELFLSFLPVDWAYVALFRQGRGSGNRQTR
jgi:hypothetical protein